MIVNYSRVQTYLHCKRYAFNQYHRNLQQEHNFALTDGSAVHEGIAEGLAKKDWDAALVKAQEAYNRDKLKITVLPEESYLFDDHWDLIKELINIFKEAMDDSPDYEVLQPECAFEVPLPNSEHNCVFLHWFNELGQEVRRPPTPEEILLGVVHRCVSPHCWCRVPHILKGKADAVIKWLDRIWLNEYKTSAMQGEQFWMAFELDMQITTYIWGIWKALGIKPDGTVVHGLFKPSESQVSAWNKKRKHGPDKSAKDYIKYRREPYTRHLDDLTRHEIQFTQICDDWEDRIVNGRFFMENYRGNCTQYNRRCVYHGMCMDHEHESEQQLFASRHVDYVDQARADQLVQIQKRLEG